MSLADPQCLSDSRLQPVLPRPEDPGQHHRRRDAPPAAVSSGDDSVCSTPCHDDGRTHCAPTRSIGTNLPPAQSPRDRDDELPLLILRSWIQSITTMSCLTDEVALTDTFH